jgi:hypothetical protein
MPAPAAPGARVTLRSSSPPPPRVCELGSFAQETKTIAMKATPELRNITFTLKRLSPTLREVRLNGRPWLKFAHELSSRDIDSMADWGPAGLYPESLAERLLSMVFDAETPGYGRFAGQVASDAAYKAAVVDRYLAHEARSEFTITDSDLISVAPSHIEVLPPRERPTWPSHGDKLRFLEVGFAFHTDINENAKRLLIPGQIYTLSHIECASSWTAVQLEETGDTTFSYNWFERV